MEPFEHDELTDRELDRILAEWKSPEAPARLRTALFREESTSLWSRFWSISFRVPLPVACGLIFLLALFFWRWESRPDHPVAVSNPSELQPVKEIRPRIIRRQDAQN
jgi:hypothetical protein